MRGRWGRAALAGTLAGLAGCHIIAGFNRLTVRDAAEIDWSRGISDKGNQEVRAVGAVGTRAIIGGSFTGTIDLGGKKLAAAGKQDGFVAALEPDGSYRFSFSLGDKLGDGDYVRPVAATGGPLVAGYFSGNLVADGHMLATGPAQEAIFLLDLDLEARKVKNAWKYEGANFSSPNDKLAMTMDPNGNVVLAGGYTGELSFPGCDAFKGASGFVNIFLAKISRSDGKCLWAVQNSDKFAQAIESVASDSGQDIVAGGEFAGTLTLKAASGADQTLMASGGIDFFIARLNPDGKALWSRSFGAGDGKFQSSARVAASLFGASALAGYFVGEIDFGDGPDKKIHTGAGHDLFITKFNPSGGHEWTKQLPLTRKACDPNACDLDKFDIAFDTAGNLVIAAAFRGSVEIDGVTLQSEANDTDFFLAKFDDQGRLLWSGRFGDSLDQCREPACRVSLAIDGERSILLGGYFENSVDFGDQLLASAGDRDGFIAKFAP